MRIGILFGIELDTVDNRLVAPIAAAILNISLDSADGEVLETILM